MVAVNSGGMSERSEAIAYYIHGGTDGGEESTDEYKSTTSSLTPTTTAMGGKAQ